VNPVNTLTSTDCSTYTNHV